MILNRAHLSSPPPYSPQKEEVTVQMKEVSDEMPTAPTADIPADILVQVPIPNTLPRPSNGNLYLTHSCNPPFSLEPHIAYPRTSGARAHRTHTHHTHTHIHTHTHSHSHTRIVRGFGRDCGEADGGGGAARQAAGSCPKSCYKAGAGGCCYEASAGS